MAVRYREKWQASGKDGKAPNAKIPVRADHIKNAVRKNSHHCMVADAIVEHFGGKSKCHWPVVDVRRGVAFTLPSTGMRYRYPILPWQAAKNVAAFDKGKPVKPFQVYLTNGVVEPAGWKAKHPNSSRKGKSYKKHGKRPAPMPPKERMNGIQIF